MTKISKSRRRTYRVHRRCIHNTNSMYIQSGH